MRYIDLHCDTLTVSCDGGYSPSDGPLQASFSKLSQSGCEMQCLAIFTEGADAPLRFEKYLSFFRGLDFKDCGFEAVLTVENLGFIGSDLGRIPKLAEAGVKMASLVWNYENALGYPNLIFKDGVPLFGRREKRGLKPLGKEAVALLDENKMIIDISHLSDGGAEDILRNRKIPVVASHSNAYGVCGVSRNLTDGLIKKVADCGGAVGVNYCKDFLGEGEIFGLIERHVKHIISVGGEDCVALGSDFDGIPAPPGLEDCTKVPALLERLEKSLGYRVCEKLCRKNFLRVFNEVCN